MALKGDGVDRGKKLQKFGDGGAKEGEHLRQEGNQAQGRGGDEKLGGVGAATKDLKTCHTEKG